MRMIVRPKIGFSSDVGYYVLNSVTNEVVPTFYDVALNSIGANAGSVTFSTSEQGVIYYAIMKAGTNRKKVLREEIYNQTLSTGILYGSEET